jgi:hypothetical protein
LVSQKGIEQNASFLKWGSRNKNTIYKPLQLIYQYLHIQYVFLQGTLWKLILNVNKSNALLIYNLYLTHWLEFLPSSQIVPCLILLLIVKYKIITNYQYINNQLTKTGLQPNPETLCILNIPHTKGKLKEICLLII